MLTYCQPDHRVTRMLILLQMSASSFTDVQFMKAFYVHNERCIATVVVKGMNFPRNIRSREQMVQGTNGPENESSIMGTKMLILLQMHKGGLGENCESAPTLCYISETTSDRAIVTIERQIFDAFVAVIASGSWRLLSRSRERMFQGTNSLGNEYSSIHNLNIISVGRVLICVVLRIAKTERSCRTILRIINAMENTHDTSARFHLRLHQVMRFLPGQSEDRLSI